MAHLVGAHAVSHIMFNADRAEKPEVVYEGYREIGRRVAAARPDLVVMISGDHLLNLGSGVHVPFAVGVGDAWTSFGDMGVPIRERPGHRDFAEGLADFLTDNRFDIVRLEPNAFRPDHAYAGPMLFNDPEHELPLVPIHVSTTLEPVPRLERCLEFGRLLGEYVRTVRPGGDRVVIQGTGGLSHWLMIEGHGRVATEFDNWVLDRFAAADMAELNALTNAEIFERSGNGGLELIYWLMTAAAVGKFSSAERIFYQPEWETGLAGITFNLGA